MHEERKNMLTRDACANVNVVRSSVRQPRGLPESLEKQQTSDLKQQATHGVANQGLPVSTLDHLNRKRLMETIVDLWRLVHPV